MKIVITETQYHYLRELHGDTPLSFEDFLKSGIVVKRKGRWGTYHYAFTKDKGNYQKNPTFDSFEQAYEWYKKNLERFCK
jgi:hypothetical protein